MGLFDGLISPAAVGGAFAQGMQTGRAEREDREVKGALSAYAMNPDDPQAFQTLAQYKPQLAIQIRQDQTKRAQEARIQALTASAAQGDKAAAAQLAGIDFDKWDKLQDNQRQALKGQVDYVGNAALQISRLPAEQRPAAWDQAIEEGVRLGYSGLAEHRGRYSEQGLQAAIANAGQVKQFIEMAEPRYQVVPEGGTLVNTKDPAALAAVASGAGAPASAPPVQVRSIDEAKRLPPGTRFVDPNGVERLVPGGPTQPASGGFRGGVSGLRPVADGRSVIQQLFPNARVTDNRRDPNSALGRANPNSWHTRSGGAVDVAPIKGMTFEQYVNRVKQAGYRVIEARDEVKNPSRHATGPHWHIVIGEA